MKKINGVIKDYAWGNNYFIGDLLNLAKDDKPKAELWYGTHPLGISTLEDGTLLTDYLKGELPFLFKVLAIDTPLSLQCHPNKEQAVREFAKEEPLHNTMDMSQWNFKDDNDKTEMLYALTPVTALCGFREFKDIKSDFNELLEEKSSLILGKDIKTTFIKLFEQKDNQNLINSFKNAVLANKSKELDNEFYTRYGLTKKIIELYPSDIGILVTYMLNIVHLKAGESMFIEPTAIHAYTKGNAIEIMSNSDNVLRAGLTQKKVDLDMLLKLGLFNSSSPYKCSIVQRQNIPTLNAPTNSFIMSPLSDGEYKISKDTLYLLFCTDGEVRVNNAILKRGECCILKENATLQVKGQAFLAR